MDPAVESAINLAARIATIIGLLISIVQTIRYRNSQKSLEQLKRSRNATIWHNISITLQAYETLDDARQIALEKNTPHKHEMLFAKISSARRSVVNQYLQLLKEAVLDEENFTEQTVEEWKRIGRLENEWRVAQAMKFVRVGPPKDKKDKEDVDDTITK